MSYQRYKTLLQGERFPLAVIDLEALKANAQSALERAGQCRIRIASKSVRSVDVLKHIFSLSTRFQGLMTFTAEETLFLAQQGFDDLLLGYPTTDKKSIAALLELTDKKITFMVDSIEHIDLLASFKRPVRVCLDIDMSTEFPGLWFGVRRSPLRTLEQVQKLLQHMKAPLKLVGVMGYEAQVAGVGDESEKTLLNPAIKLLQRLSHKDYNRRRGEIVTFLQQNYALEFINGGGTGSLEWSSQDAGVDEVTVGSGFYAPGLFDSYSRFKLKPAAFFALEVVRRPSDKIWTCLGGGYIASGEIDINKRPLPYLPEGLKLIEQEGCGEVQTPVEYHGGEKISLGDPLFFRHAKAGELCERFNELLLIQGETKRRVPTYRGQGHAFL